MENLLDKLKAWEEIENRAIDIFDIYRTEICEEKSNKQYRFLDYIDVNFEKKHVTLNFDEILPGDYETHCNWMDIPFEYFSGEKDVKKYLKTLDV